MSDKSWTNLILRAGKERRDIGYVTNETRDLLARRGCSRAFLEHQLTILERANNG